ncbi:MAG TPA: phasin family protein [Polyangia bacterium]|jgi:BMFP domain-containing protein YqiC
MATEISDKLRDGLSTAKSQFGELQDKAMHSFTDVQQQVTEVPNQLRGAWERVVHRICAALDVPSREEFDTIVKRLEGIENRLDKLSRKAAAPKKAPRR